MGVLKKLLFLVIFLMLVNVVSATDYTGNSLCPGAVNIPSGIHTLQADQDCSMSGNGPTIEAGAILDCRGFFISTLMTYAVSLTDGDITLKNCDIRNAAGTHIETTASNFNVSFINSSFAQGPTIGNGGTIFNKDYITINTTDGSSAVGNHPITRIENNNTPADNFFTPGDQTDGLGFKTYEVTTRTYNPDVDYTDVTVNVQSGTEQTITTSGPTTFDFIIAGSSDNAPTISLTIPTNPTTFTRPIDQIINFTAEAIDDNKRPATIIFTR